MKKYRNLSNILKKRIVIEESIESDDGSGGFVSLWVEKMVIWAQIKPISAMEDFEANQIEDKISHIVIVRYIDGITSKMRILYNDRIFNIKGVINVMEQNRVLEIKAEEIL